MTRARTIVALVAVMTLVAAAGVDVGAAARTATSARSKLTATLLVLADFSDAHGLPEPFAQRPPTALVSGLSPSLCAAPPARYTAAAVTGFAGGAHGAIYSVINMTLDLGDRSSARAMLRALQKAADDCPSTFADPTTGATFTRSGARRAKATPRNRLTFRGTSSDTAGTPLDVDEGFVRVGQRVAFIAVYSRRATGVRRDVVRLLDTVETSLQG